MALDKARGFTQKALKNRRDAREMEQHNPAQAKKLHKKADKASTQAAIQRENVRGRKK